MRPAAGKVWPFSDMNDLRRRDGDSFAASGLQLDTDLFTWTPVPTGQLPLARFSARPIEPAACSEDTRSKSFWRLE
jgi:hypothetical protein